MTQQRKCYLIKVEKLEKLPEMVREDLGLKEGDLVNVTIEKVYGKLD